jgi:hypothetical protein
MNRECATNLAELRDHGLQARLERVVRRAGAVEGVEREAHDVDVRDGELPRNEDLVVERAHRAAVPPVCAK